MVSNRCHDLARNNECMDGQSCEADCKKEQKPLHQNDYSPFLLYVDKHFKPARPRTKCVMRGVFLRLCSLSLTLALCESTLSRSALLFQAPLSFFGSAFAPRNLHSKKSMGDCASLRTEIIPSQEQHDSVIIFLHGSGDSGQGIAEALKSLSFNFSKTKIVCPTAPFRKYSLYGDEGRRPRPNFLINKTVSPRSIIINHLGLLPCR
jgi:hypothetical protein